MPEERTAVLIIRAWVEPHPTAPLRATIRWTTDVSAGLNTQTFADAEAVTQFVRSWLSDIEAAHTAATP
jgi:hypothetical protein